MCQDIIRQARIHSAGATAFEQLVCQCRTYQGINDDDRNDSRESLDECILRPDCAAQYKQGVGEEIDTYS